MKEGLRGVFKKATGIDAFERRMNRPDFLDFLVYPSHGKTFEAVFDGVMQVTMPISFENVSSSLEDEGHSLRDNHAVIVLAVLADAGISVWAALSVIFNHDPALAVGAKVVYNAGAAVLPDAIEAAKQKLSGTR